MPQQTPNNLNILCRLVFESAPDATAIVALDGRIVAGNRAFEETCRGTGRLLIECSEIASAGSKSIPLECGWKGPVQWQCRDGKFRPFFVTVTALTDGENNAAAFALSLSPLSTELLAEPRKPAAIPQASKQAFREELHERKLQSLGVLASSVAHDLNNILTSVLGHVSFLRLSLPDAPAHRESLTAIEDGARRAASITGQILEFARGKELELSTVNLSLVIAAGINLLRSTLPEQVQVRFKSGKEDLYVYGDESQLSQLVMNLLVNAGDALTDGGLIELCIETAALDDDEITEQLELLPGEYVSFSVRDNGHGIPPAIQERIFEPFFTTKTKNGTGLGLATVHSIVKAHRGGIRVESREGQGTYFQVFLPLSIETQSLTEEEEPQAALPKGNERILVVDDEEAVRMVMQRSLEHLGYEVLIAEDGGKALELFKLEAATIGLVILDMIMPVMPGDELFYKMLEVRPDVKVLIASGYASDARTKAILSDGALGYIQKPFDVEELAQEVRRCLDC